MKWTTKRPIYDDERYIKKFLFFPTRIKREICWLETASIFQIWRHGWKNIFFATEQLSDDLKRNKEE